MLADTNSPVDTW